MNKRIIWTICIVSVALYGGFCLIQWFWKNGSKTTAQEAVGPGADLTQTVLAFTIDGRSPKGAKQWHLEGNSAEIKGEEVHLKDLKVIAYGDDSTVNLVSISGIYYKELGEIELIGDVVVTSNDGSVLTTEKAKWSQNTKDVVTDEVVHIKREGMIAVGEGGTANSEKKTATLKKNVLVMLKPATRVKCDGPLDVKYNDNVAIFYKNVKVKDKDGKLFTDKLTVNFDQETRKVKQVVGEGNVRIKRGESYSVSETVVYEETTKSAKLLGKPRLVIAPEELAELDESDEYEDKNFKDF